MEEMDLRRDKFAFAHGGHDIVWMSQNTNTIPTSPKIAEAIKESIDKGEYANYPYANGLFGLPEAIKEDLGLLEHEVIITNGALEATYIASRALLGQGREVISTDPTYQPIHELIGLSGARIVEFGAYEAPCKLLPDQVNEAVSKRTKMILLLDPLNPMGSGYTRGEVKALCEIAEDHDLWILHDVTYRDFADNHVEASEFLPERTIVCYSFSKNCGLAGLRIGALLATPQVMRLLEPYNPNILSVSLISQRAALAALETKKEWIDRVVGTTRRNGERIKHCVENADGVFLPNYPSHANMLCIDISETGVNPEALEEKLLFEHHIFIRAGSYLSRRFGPRFVRVSFSVPEEQCDRYVKVFPEVLEELAASRKS